MSGSNERKEQQSARRQERAAQEAAAARRSNRIYAAIGAVFVVLLAVTLVWRSGILGRTVPAAVVDGQSYTAAEVDFYYQNVYRAFLQQNSYLLSYLGLDTTQSLDKQEVNETASSMLGIPVGRTWQTYFLDEGLKEIALIQGALREAEAEGFVWPASVEEDYEESVKGLESSAAASGRSVNALLKNSMGSVMTKSVYLAQLKQLLRYDAYVSARQERISYTMDELEAFYQEDPRAYDSVSYEYVTLSGEAPESEDAEGNLVEPTEAESAAAMAEAKKNADAILAALRAGGSLEQLAEERDGALYFADEAEYSGSDVTEWLFDDARRAGDSAVIETGSGYQVLHFFSRSRDGEKTVDVRHILVTSEDGTLAEGEEGYEDEQAQLKAAARLQAEGILNEWKSGAATEESFAELAQQYSADGGSKAEGGLYTEVYEGMMVPTFNDWCFDKSRKSGDTGVVDSDYGSHVMYYVADNLPHWAVEIRDEKISETMNAWTQSLTEDAQIEQKSFGLSFLA